MAIGGKTGFDKGRQSVGIQDKNRDNDWMRTLLRTADEAAQRREAEEKRRRQAEEDRQRLLMQQKQQREEAARRKQADRDAYIDRNIKDRLGETGRIPRYDPEAAQRTEIARTALGREYDEREIARQWIESPSGQGFLTGKRPKKDEDPYEFLVRDPDFTQWLTLETAAEELRSRGVPDPVIKGVFEYLGTEEGGKKYRPMGIRDYGGPIEVVVSDLTGSKLAGQVASVATYAIPGIGAALGGAEAGSRPGPESGAGLWLEAAGEVGNALVMGPTVNALEKAVVDWTAGKVGGGVLRDLVARVLVRAGLNVAEDTPITAAQLGAVGINPASPEGREILRQQAMISAAAGGAVPLVGTGLRGAARVPGAPEVGAAASVYGGSMLAGQDREDALKNAALAGGVVAGRHIPRVVEAASRAEDRLAQRLGIEPEIGAVQFRAAPARRAIKRLEELVAKHPEDERYKALLEELQSLNPPPYKGPPVGVQNLDRTGEPPIRRGKAHILSRIDMEVRMGKLSQDDGRVANDFVESLPTHYLDSLGISMLGRESLGGVAGSKVVGQYFPVESLVRIAKDSGHAGRAVIHEVFHHIDNFLPPEERVKLVTQWAREMGTRWRQAPMLPGAGKGGQAIVDVQPVLEKLLRRDELVKIRDGFTSSKSRQKWWEGLSDEDKALVRWSPSPEEKAAIDAAYGYLGGFKEWFAETMTNKSLRGPQTVDRGPLATVAYHVGNLLVGLYNFLLARGERDAAERVYKEIMEGRYQQFARQSDEVLAMDSIDGPAVREILSHEEIYNKWSQAKARNSARAATDLDALEKDGYVVDDARAALDEYRDTRREDFDDADEYSDARTEAWEAFVDALDSLEREWDELADAPAALPPASPQAVGPQPVSFQPLPAGPNPLGNNLPPRLGVGGSLPPRAPAPPPPPLPPPPRAPAPPPPRPPAPPAPQPAAPQPPGPPVRATLLPTVADAEDTLRRAGEGGQVGEHQLIDLLKKMPGGKAATVIPELIDPSSKFSRPVRVGAVAVMNWFNGQAMTLASHANEIAELARPLVGEHTGRIVGRTAATAAPVAAASTAAATIPMSDDQRRMLIFSGLVGSTAFLHYNPVRKNMPFQHVQLVPGATLPSGWDRADLIALKLRGNELLGDILEHPEDYALSAEQRASVTALQAMQDARFAATNAIKQWANAGQIGQLPQRGFFQMWDKASKKKALPENHPMFSDARPDPLRPGMTERPRDIPDVRTGLKNYPGLKLADSPIRLMLADVMDKAKIEANAIFAKAMVSGPEGVKGGWADFSKYEALESRVNGIRAAIASGAITNVQGAQRRLQQYQAQLATEKMRLQNLGVELNGKGRWQPIPGLDIGDYRFAPKVIEDLRKLYPEAPGVFENWADQLTANVRTLVFSTDMSAWTIQGLMLAAMNPRAMIRYAPTLLSTSIIGDKFTGRWVEKNWDWIKPLVDRGVVTGRWAEELTSGAQAKSLPGVKELENRGFQNFLPVARLLVAKHSIEGEALFSALEASAPTRAFSKLGLNTASRLTMDAATWAPALYGLSLAKDDDLEGWEKVFAAAIGLGLTTGVSSGRQALGRAALPRIDPDVRAKIETRVARQINRSSGTLHKAQLGITKRQSWLERVVFFNSPAFTRNMFLALKYAVGTGPEAAMAQMYLLRAGLLTAGTMVGLKYLATGEMDSLDFSDPDSVLNPKYFGRATTGEEGTFAVSNPVFSLMRAAMNTPEVEGVDPRSFEGWTWQTALGGLADSMVGRTPLLAGEGWRLLRERLGPDEGEANPFGFSTFDQTGDIIRNLDKAAKGDIGGLGGAVEAFAPLPLESVRKAGWLTPFPGDPNYNRTSEKIAQVGGAFAGMQASPETLAQERRRITDTGIREQFPGIEDINQSGKIDLLDLNERDRELFRGSQVGQQSAQLGEQISAQHGGQPASPEDAYLASLSEHRDWKAQSLADLSSQYMAGDIDGYDFRKRYQELQREYQARIDTTRTDFEKLKVNRLIKDPETGKPTNMTVTQYFDRAFRDEDKAVDGWYALYDGATKNGQLDFERLEEMQTAYLKKLKPEVRSYVTERAEGARNKGITDSEGNVVPVPALDAYKNVKEEATPYWEIEEKYWPLMQQYDPFFRDFRNYSEYKDWLAGEAANLGRSAAQLESVLADTHPILEVVAQYSDLDKRKMRGESATLDYGLADFYRSSPANPYGFIAAQFGDKSYDAYGPAMAYEQTRPSTEELSYFKQFMERRGKRNKRNFITEYFLR